MKKIAEAFLIINICIALLCIVCLFLVTDKYGVYANGICAISALGNCVGLILLMRLYMNGGFCVLGTSILAALGLFMTCSDGLESRFGEIGSFLPFIICLLYVGILALSLLSKKDGKPIWKQMSRGWDYAHGRHIYQIIAFFLIGVLVIAFIVMPKGAGLEYLDEEFDEKTVIENISEKRLDSPDITIEEVNSFERQYNRDYNENQREEKIVRRIFALKHLLLSALMTEIHTSENFINICVAHNGDFSKEQQRIIDWFSQLPKSEQREWNGCEKVKSLSEFKEVIENSLHYRK